jgi:sulfate permease, SulP family
VIGGLLLYLGLSMVLEWAVETRHKLPRSAWWTVLIILASVGVLGFLPGVMVGVVAAIITFVVRYSGVDVIKTELTGAVFQSNVDRPPAHLKLLRECGDQLVILKLHGFIFFGTANHLLTRVSQRAEDPKRPPLKFMVLDFREVTGIDASAVISMIKMHMLARRVNFTLVFTHLAELLRHQMEHSGLNLAGGQNVQIFPDLDHGMESCENELLCAQGVQCAVEQHPLAEYFELMAPGELNFADLTPYLQRTEVPAGQVILRQGDASDDMLFLEAGVVTVLLELDTGQPVRLRKMGAGTVVGELGLYLRQNRAASVVTDEPAVFYRLSRASLSKMEENSPKTAAAFHRIMVRILAQRLVNTDRTIKALLD